MSDAAELPEPTIAATRWSMETVGSVLIACFAQAIFAGALVLAVMKVLPPESILLLLGAVIANAQQAASYFLGSSTGSKGKDVTIASQSQQLAQSVPTHVVPVVPTPAKVP